MKTPRLALPICGAVALAVLGGVLQAAERGAPPDARELRLWSGVAPGSEPGRLPSSEFAEEWTGEAPRRAVRFTTVPALHGFLPPTDRSNGAALVIAPGGGYNTVVIEHEGWRIARRLAEEGLAVFVLKYRHWDRDLARSDARRAVRVVRARAAEWGLDPHRIGLGGFSAGGHLALNATAHSEIGEPRGDDAIDRVDSRPDFLLLVYPTPVTRLPEGAVVDAQFPATFIACAVEDHAEERVLALSSLLLKARVRHESHLFASGVHGFGLGEDLPGTREWPRLFAAWLRAELAPAGGMRSPVLPPATPWGAPKKQSKAPRSPRP